MKLSGREAVRFCAAPDQSLTGVLLFGADSGMVLQRRQQLVRAILDGDADPLRVTQMTAAETRRDPESLWSALRSRGFFPGRQVVLITDAADSVSRAIAAALDGATKEDALLVVTAEVLPARSGLRKLFETGAQLAALQFFADRLGPEEISSELTRRGLHGEISADALTALAALGEEMDYGSFMQLLEIISIFSFDRSDSIDVDDIALLAPAGLDADLGRFVDAVAAGRSSALGPLMQRLTASDVAPVTLLIALQRHFRVLLRIISADTGPESALQQIRPPLWGDRRRAVQAQIRKWDAMRLAQANRLLFETDSRVRSSVRTPDMALVERCALRLALMGGR